MFKKIPLVVLIVFSIGADAHIITRDATLDQRIRELESIKVLPENINNKITEGQFDKIFELYNSLNDEQLALQKFSNLVDTDRVINNLDKSKAVIANEAFNIVLRNTGKIFPKSANFTPKGIIVLGSTPGKGILERRLDDAYKMAIDDKSLPIILSGKGRKEGVVEADYMYNYLIRKGLNGDRLYKESLSLDTVGNAEFSYFTITENESLKDITDWLVITNNFHAMRSLNTFQYIFPNNYRLEVYLSPLLSEGVKNPDRLKILKQFVTREVKSVSNPQFMELLTNERFNKKEQQFKAENIAGQPCAILQRILIKHPLYNDKVDEFTERFSKCFTAH
ncbi:YdcF family protein [Enterovibrio nigricans]|uniref:DUF218 domain-containing protein n=1 Tax=Enterovibrio nigricans DSM 22720 TaxID=1121868 RepID=A0A1T4VUH0_9GAMM|nr:YdcF family protein [Enterovibrio nigricans]SKA68613.1 DUF218 domain-containing protein [Enterovibrio nigricans DSM 22720]